MMNTLNKTCCPACDLMSACIANDQVEVKNIIQQGIDINVTTVCNTALFYTIEEGKIVLLKLLLESGANPERKYPITHEKAIWTAIKHKKTAAVNLLIDYGARLEDFPLNTLVSERDEPLEVINVLEFGVDINTVDSTGRSALHIAAMYGYIETAKILLNNGIKTELKDCWGQLAYELAERNGHYEMMDLIRR